MFNLRILGIFISVVLLGKGGNARDNATDVINTILRNYDQSPPDGSTAVKLGIYVHNCYAISEQNMDFTMTMYFRQSWVDPRLKFDSAKAGTDKILFREEQLTQIWVSDIFFRNEKSATFHMITTPNRLMTVRENGALWFVNKVTATLSCPMRFQKFPFDTQMCPMIFESFKYTMDTIAIEWMDSPVNVDKGVQLPGYTLQDFILYDCSQNFTAGAFPCLEIRFLLKRDSGFFITQIYIPSILVVILSWFAFWFSVDAVSVRAGIVFAEVYSGSMYVPYRFNQKDNWKVSIGPLQDNLVSDKGIAFENVHQRCDEKGRMRAKFCYVNKAGSNTVVNEAKKYFRYVFLTKRMIKIVQSLDDVESESYFHLAACSNGSANLSHVFVKAYFMQWKPDMNYWQSSLAISNSSGDGTCIQINYPGILSCVANSGYGNGSCGLNQLPFAGTSEQIILVKLEIDPGDGNWGNIYSVDFKPFGNVLTGLSIEGTAFQCQKRTAAGIVTASIRQFDPTTYTKKQYEIMKSSLADLHTSICNFKNWMYSDVIESRVEVELEETPGSFKIVILSDKNYDCRSAEVYFQNRCQSDCFYSPCKFVKVYRLEKNWCEFTCPSTRKVLAIWDDPNAWYNGQIPFCSLGVLNM